MSRNKLALVILLLIGLLLLLGFFRKDDEIKPAKPTLQSTVEQAMTGSKGRYGIVIKNFSNGESYSFNEHQIFEAGSLYKLWVAATVFQQIKGGLLKEDELLSEDIDELNQIFNIASESAEFKTGSVNFTVSQALKQMITISHNYAALTLIKTVKRSNVAKFLEKADFKESFLGDPPKSTAYDIALFLEKLYQGKLNLIDVDSSQKIIELLKEQKLNDGLPKYLPSQIPVAHKTADIGLFKHDAGIIYSPIGDYLIVVLSESDYPPGAQERIALLSQAVFDYFNSLEKSKKKG
ncbi:serine hydrolase [Candidatus Daviesbacteria bacterium]|nr:serine hydrolase [Candidatus Daviesbacteria bacterium]